DLPLHLDGIREHRGVRVAAHRAAQPEAADDQRERCHDAGDRVPRAHPVTDAREPAAVLVHGIQQATAQVCELASHESWKTLPSVDGRGLTSYPQAHGPHGSPLMRTP